MIGDHRFPCRSAGKPTTNLGSTDDPVGKRKHERAQVLATEAVSLGTSNVPDRTESRETFSRSDEDAAALVFTGSLEKAIEDWGFLPAEPLRHGGLSIITSFVLHGGWFHALSNMYFLAVFGDDVEDDLGHWRFAALLVVAHIAGCIAHALLDPRIGLPLVGASAGISGVITYYAIAFPRARIGFPIRYYYRFSWVRLPAVAWLVIWLLLQAWMSYRQGQGLGNVSALAHLGGAGVGVMAALALRIRHRRALEETGG